jgi:hypothetical protein
LRGALSAAGLGAAIAIIIKVTNIAHPSMESIGRGRMTLFCDET